MTETVRPVPATDEQWRRLLTPEQYEVLRQKGTEPPFSGAYATTKEDGIYRCAGCGAELFDSATKYESGTGWPSFFEPISPDAVELIEDSSHGMRRNRGDVCSLRRPPRARVPRRTATHR